jgi:hypothetical protein
LGLPVTVIITVLKLVKASGRGIGVLPQMISYQLDIGRVKIYGLRVVVEKVVQRDTGAKVYLADHTPLVVVNLVPLYVVSLVPLVVVNLVPLYVVSLVPLVVVSLVPLVVVLLDVSLAEDKYTYAKSSDYS